MTLDSAKSAEGSSGADFPAPLSFAQRQLWFLDQLDGDHLEYLDSIALRLHGPVNLSALRAALQTIVARHAPLRTRYIIVGTEPCQVVDDACPLPFEVHNLGVLSADERERAAMGLVEREASQPFDLAAAAPLRIRLVRLSNDDHILLIVIHHIATDAWSRSLLASELGEQYSAFATATPISATEPAMSYCEFARWQRQQLTGPATEQLTEFWRERLSGLEPLHLRTDYRRGPVRETRGRGAGFYIPPTLRRAAAGFGRRHGATPFMTFLGIYAALLHRYTGQQDIAVGTPTAGRSRAEVEDLIGCFTNMLVTRTDLSHDPSPAQLLERVRDSMLPVYAHDEMPFELLVDRLSPQRDLSVNPLVSHVFAWHNTPRITWALAGIEVEPLPAVRTSAKFDLTLRLTPDDDGGLAGEAEYSTALFKPATMERLASHYLRLLEQAIASPDTPLSRLDLLTTDDRLVLRENRKPSESEAITETLHGLFEQQVARTPDAVAIRDEQTALTYDQLNSRANQLARLLRTLGVNADTLVAIVAEPGVELITALLATLKAGGAYLPINPSTPVRRIAAILDDSLPTVLITDEKRTGLDHPRTVVLDRDQSTIGQFADDDGQVKTSSGNLAYVIYTSGSTGAPKGVMVTHANAVRLFTSARPQFQFGSDDVWTMFHSAAFDFSVWEMWGALLHGGLLVIVSPETARSPARFLELVTSLRVTILNQTPAAFRGFTDAAVSSAAPLADLRLVINGGEAPDLAALSPWFGSYGGDRPALVNMYGITETTVHVTARRLTRADLDRRYSPIGKPLSDMRVYLLDDAMNQAAVGIPAEIYVGGSGLARGYLNRPGLTAERFIADPFGDEPGARLYRTGDLARLLADGDIEYLGRIDDQVKIRGFRIELGEVEAALNDYPAVAHGAVAVHEISAAERQLVAYVVWNPPETAQAAELRTYLAQRLPGYMVPASYVTMPTLPRTAGGKLDRKALPNPDLSRRQAGPRQRDVAPRSLAETLMCRAWTEELGLDRVSVEDDFFDVGGDSIRAVRLVGRLRAQGWAATVEMIFQHRTVLGVLQALERTGATVADVSVRPFSLTSPGDREQLPADLTDAYPLAMTQLGMLFEMEVAPDTHPYHDVVSYPIRDPGGFEETPFRRACAVLADRHEILRTSFNMLSYGDPLQLVHCQAMPRVTVTDLRHIHPAEASRLVEQTRQTEAAATFDITQAPLLRMHVDVLRDDHWVLTQTESHAILDGWSNHFLLRELLECYRELRDSRPRTSPPANHASPLARFADFVALERSALDNRDSVAFWSGRIETFEPLEFPLRPEGTGRPGSIRRERIDLHPGDQRLQDVARTEGVPLKTVLLTAHVMALARFTGRRRFLTGLVCNGRPEVRGGDQVAGMFLNTVPFGVHLRGSWRQLIRAVYEEELALWPHRRFPLQTMQQRWGGSHRLLPALFSYQDFHVLDHEMVEGEGIVSSFPLEFALQVTAEPAALVITGRTDRMSPDVIDRLADLHRQALAALAARPAEPLHAFLEPTPREAELLAAWSQAATAPAAAAPLHDLITAQASTTPDVLAIDADDTRLTYAQLDRRSTTLARRLRRAGIRDGDIIGIHLKPGATAITAVLAAWKAGAAFLPLDPDLPPTRITAMIADASPARLITDTPTPRPDLDLLFTAPGGEDGDGDGEESADDSLPAVGPNHLAYLMYTSGSTGQPKAVMIQHRGVTNHATAQIIPQLRAAVGEDKLRMLTGTSAFISDFFIVHLTTLADGHTLVVLTREQLQDPRHLVALAADPARAITAMNCTTSQLQLLVDAGLLDAPHPPRMVAFGGEACPPDLWATLRNHTAITAINGYGPTEATVETTIAYVAESPAPLIGRPCGNAQVRLLDEEQRPVPPGTIGELCIAGPGVGPGYLGYPAQTAAAFIPDPAGPPGSRMYRTGDLARFTPAGLLEYHGRNDHQLKILGQRVEPEEVETALRAHPAITAAAVTAHDSAAGFQLTAHIIPSPGTDPDLAAIRAWLAERLPPSAVPARYAIATDLPLTPGGKLDRKALAQTTAATVRSASPPPTTPAEQQIAQLWADLLSTDPASLGIHDDFFALGGHSLLAARLALRISADLRADIPLHQIFAHPTIARQAAWIGEHAPAATPIPRLDRVEQELVPASFAQERLWFLWRMAPDSPGYHVSWCYQAGGLDVAALATAIDAMIARHEIFRTTLHEHDGQLVQRVNPPWQCALTAADATPAQAAAAAKTAAAELFDLSAGPLLRVRAWRTGPAVHLLLFTAHHVVMDEWSLDIFERELWALYAADGDPAAAGLAALDIQYADYAAWHRALTTSRADADQAWWQHTLDGAAPASPPPDRIVPAYTSFAGDRAQAVAGPATADWLTTQRTAAATTDFVVLLAAWCLFLVRHTGQRDLTVGTPTSGRTHPDTADLIGFLVNSLALRVRVSPAADFPALVAHVRQVVLDAFAHQDIPFEHVVRAVAPRRDAARNPLFTTNFAWAPATGLPARDLPAGLTLTPLPAGVGGSHFDLSLTAARTAEGLVLRLEYSTDLYDPATIAGYLHSLTDLLAALAARPGAPLHAFLEPTPSEAALLAAWSQAV